MNEEEVTIIGGKEKVVEGGGEEGDEVTISIEES